MLSVPLVGWLGGGGPFFIRIFGARVACLYDFMCVQRLLGFQMTQNADKTARECFSGLLWRVSEGTGGGLQTFCDVGGVIV